MDKKKSFLNVTVAIAFKLVLFALSILSRRMLIQYVGNDANGIHSLYMSVLGVLSLTELGVGSAISYSMYQPIVDKNEKKVAALYHMFVKIYRVIAVVLLGLGLAVTPLIPFLANEYQANFSLHITFLIMLASVVFTYTYNAKIALVNAYKNNYITTTIVSVGQIILFVLQIVVLYLYKSFELFLISRIVSEIVQAILIDLYVKKHHKEILRLKEKVDSATKNEVVKNIKAMFMHKVGAVLINSTDSIIISLFVNVYVLGLYSNYTAIVSAMAGVLGLFFSPLTSIIGHMCAEQDVEKDEKYLNLLYFMNYALGCVFYLGYYGIIDNLIVLFFGKDLTMEWYVPFIITLNYFVQFMRQSVLLFRDATGAFYNDRWKPFVEGVVNIILSVLFVQWFGIVGVIVATIITNLLICHTVEPWALYTSAFGKKPIKYYWVNFGSIALFAIALIALHLTKVTHNEQWIELILNGCIAVGWAVIPLAVFWIGNKAAKRKSARKFPEVNVQ